MKPDPKIVRRFAELTWPHLPTNIDVLEELEELLWKAASSKGGAPLVYSEWVRDLEFVVPTYFNGQRFTMNINDWLPQFTHVIGDILGWLNAKSYSEHGVLISAMAINKESNQPGERFYGLSKDVGLFTGKSENEKQRFWIEQMDLVKAFAKTQRVQSGPDFESFVRFVRDGELTIKEIPMRQRCAELVSAAREAHRRSDGALACIVCNWVKPIGPIRGEIVHMHHLTPVRTLPTEGRVVCLSDAKILLVPLCPTCHSLAHAREGGGEFNLEELKKLHGIK